MSGLRLHLDGKAYEEGVHFRVDRESGYVHVLNAPELGVVDEIVMRLPEIQPAKKKQKRIAQWKRR